MFGSPSLISMATGTVCSPYLGFFHGRGGCTSMSSEKTVWVVPSLLKNMLGTNFFSISPSWKGQTCHIFETTSQKINVTWVSNVQSFVQWLFWLFSFLGGDAFWFLLFEIHHDRGVWRFYNDPLEFTRDWREYNLGLGYRWVLPISLQKQRKKVKPYLKLMASVHLNIDFGVSVCNGPLSVMQVWWAAPKIKATSYYSNHILSAAHMTCSNPHRIRYAIWYMIAIMKRMMRNTGMRIMKMIIKNRRDCM